MLDELQKKKLEHLFHVLDANENGRLEQADFTAVAHRLADQRGWARDAPERAALETGYLRLWSAILSDADRNHDGMVSMLEWLQWHELMLSRESVFNHVIMDMARWLFEACDADGDGRISGDDYQRLFRAHALAEDASADCFARLDSNGDGFLSKAEVFAGIREFYFSTDPRAPGNCLFGALE
ncbi:EF-hand domain-containing protein [Haliangium sp.]|uniref:EF-hand domain-containing protein n=1 Tax=Haliangium sp. TaxID=2663208 RepID=UPI003D0EC806